MESTDADLIDGGPPTKEVPAFQEGGPVDNVTPLQRAPEGGGKRTHFITFEEMQGSQGEANFQEKVDRKERPGVLITVQQGTVVGWLMLRLRAIESQLFSQAGLITAAGTEISRLHEKYEPEETQPAETSGGLLVPPGAKSGGLLVPPGAKSGLAVPR